MPDSVVAQRTGAIYCRANEDHILAVFLSVYLGSIPTLLLLNAIGNKLLRGEYLTMALLGGLLVLGVALLYLFRGHIFALLDHIHAARDEKKAAQTKS